MSDQASTPSKFDVGQIVVHRRYHYRGVILDGDAQCEASADWYAKNQTQPAREPPWYHVLVHGAMHTTYVAESNLSLDPKAERIAHPLLDRYFQSYYEGRYYTSPVN